MLDYMLIRYLHAIQNNIVVVRCLYLFYGLKVTSNNLKRLHKTQPYNLYEIVYVNSGIYDGVGTLLNLDLTNIR
jgi:hypothetical protein